MGHHCPTSYGHGAQQAGEWVEFGSHTGALPTGISTINTLGMGKLGQTALSRCC